MTATSAPHRPDPTRTGAVWVTGTGAFLLLAAAAVFTAVRWEQIPDAAKLAALGLATGGFLLAGRRLEATLPATAGALFHLGAFLVPIDVAAIGVRVHLDWSTLLLAEGVAATATFAWAAATERSIVLRWAAGAASVVLVAGIGATTPLPPALLLVAFACASFALGHDNLAVGWAAAAGLAPVFALTEGLITTGAGTVERLGLFPGRHPLASAATAIAAAGVLSLVGRRRDDADYALVGAIVAITGLAAAWAGTDPAFGHTVVGLAASFLVIELAALATRDDPFWAGPGRLVAVITERVAIVAFLPLVAAAVLVQSSGDPDHGVALAGLLLAAAWAVGDRRRAPGGLLAPTLAVGTCAFVAVACTTTDLVALGAAAAALAALSMLADRADGPLVTVVGGSAAALLVWSRPGPLVIFGAIGALTIAESAVRRSRRALTDPAKAKSVEEDAWVLSACALAPVGIAVWGLAVATGHTAGGLIAGAGAVALLAMWMDRGVVSGELPLGTIARLGVVAVLAGTAELPVAEVAVVAIAVAAMSLLDAVRLRQPMVALGASLAGPIAIGAFVRWTGMSTPSTGVALTVSAVVMAGLGSLLPRAWMVPAAGAAAFALAGGLVLASGDPAAFADALMIAGGVGLAASISVGRVEGIYASGLVTTAGIWLRLGDAGVASSEPYLLPVAALLVVAGMRSRSAGTSSWIAYGPAIALLGGAALAERLAGGPGWHSLIAGTVGVVAVAVGGDRRLAAPLVLGTMLLVAVAGYETLAITAGLPTWTWLALGGAALLGAGVAMERRDMGPLETGRRLVDVVAERFS